VTIDSHLTCCRKVLGASAASKKLNSEKAAVKKASAGNCEIHFFHCVGMETLSSLMYISVTE